MMMDSATLGKNQLDKSELSWPYGKKFDDYKMKQLSSFYSVVTGKTNRTTTKA